MRRSQFGSNVETVTTFIAELEGLMGNDENIDLVMTYLGSTEGHKLVRQIAPDLLAKAREFREDERIKEEKTKKWLMEEAEKAQEDNRLLRLPPLEIIELGEVQHPDSWSCAKILYHVGLGLIENNREKTKVSGEFFQKLDPDKYKKNRDLRRSKRRTEICLVRFPQGRDPSWISSYCDHKPQWQMGEIWDLPNADKLRDRTIVIPGSSWLPTLNLGGEVESYPVILPCGNTEPMIAEIMPYSFSSSSGLYWLMRRVAPKSGVKRRG